MKSTLLLVTVGAMLVAGCGSKQPAEPAASGKKIVIGYSQSTLQDPWRKAMNAELEVEEQTHPNVTLLKQDAQNDAAMQKNEVETLDTQGIEALMISPKESGPLTPVISKIYKKGIPVILLDRGIDSEDYTTLVGADNVLIGKQAGEYVKTRYPKGARIIEIAGLKGATATAERARGFREGLGDLRKYNIVASQPADYKRGPAITVMENMLTANDNVQVVYAHNDEMALGAVSVLKKHGVLKAVAVIGVDGQNEAIDAVAKGDMAATFVYPRPGADGLKAALEVLAGKKVEKRIILQTTQITKENAAQFVGKGF
jgi:ribose transport system substrate-binding protein